MNLKLYLFVLTSLLLVSIVNAGVSFEGQLCNDVTGCRPGLTCLDRVCWNIRNYSTCSNIGEVCYEGHNTCCSGTCNYVIDIPGQIEKQGLCEDNPDNSNMIVMIGIIVAIVASLWYLQNKKHKRRR